jgi:hypothetical protein
MDRIFACPPSADSNVFSAEDVMRGKATGWDVCAVLAKEPGVTIAESRGAVVLAVGGREFAALRPGGMTVKLPGNDCLAAPEVELAREAYRFVAKLRH